MDDSYKRIFISSTGSSSPTVEDANLSTVQSNELLRCPFCGEKGFDKIGLKGHLEHMDCEIYNDLRVPRRIF
jgi:hypothetical protein